MSGSQRSKFARETRVIDLFCGIGGLTHGLEKAGLDVVVGIDNDANCRYGYEKNNGATFIEKDISEVSAQELIDLFGENTVRVLVGCAPCQPFSKLNLRKLSSKELEPLEKFAKLVDEIKPDIVSMENVAGLFNSKRNSIFSAFLEVLKKNKYFIEYKVVNLADYGVPQTRKRLVLLASKFGNIELTAPTHLKRKRTVRDVIGNLQPIGHGRVSKNDYLHRARKLNPTNLERIKATPPDGGNSDAWELRLRLNCHQKETGRTYSRNVYARMAWDKPAPSLTTQCIGLGNGRYGHPTQNRAITLREAALLQTFPKSYIFSDPSSKLIVDRIAKFIGNAVPVRLGYIIGKSINMHLAAYGT